MPTQAIANHFKTREEAIAEIEAAGLYWTEVDLLQAPTELDRQPHRHDYEMHFYVLEGQIEMHEPDLGRVHRIGPGGKLSVPRKTTHFGVHAGYKGVIGLDVDPKTLPPAPPKMAAAAD